MSEPDLSTPSNSYFRCIPDSGRCAKIPHTDAMGHFQTPAPQQRCGLFNHLIGDSEQLVRNGQPERLRSREIDDKLELGRLLHRHVGRLLSVEYATDVCCC